MAGARHRQQGGPRDLRRGAAAVAGLLLLLLLAVCGGAAGEPAAAGGGAGGGEAAGREVARHATAGAGLTEGLAGWLAGMERPAAIHSGMVDDRFPAMGAGFKVCPPPRPGARR